MFDISGELCEGEFETGRDAMIGGHARLSAAQGSTVRVGALTGYGVDWLGKWIYADEPVWQPTTSLT
jgi:hypothetical protein